MIHHLQKQKWIRLLLFAASTFCVQNVCANSLQIFCNSTFVNPANLTQTEKGQAIVGVNYFNIFYNFKGTILGTTGLISSNKEVELPYFQYAYRYSNKIVFGFDLVHPTVDFVNWPADGFQNVLGIDAVVQSEEFTPKMSYSITNNLAVGGAVRLSRIYNVQLNYNLPPIGFIKNQSEGWGYGGALGLWYMINQQNFLDLSFFSHIKAKTKGTSVSGNFVNKKYFIAPLEYLPTTFILNFTHIFTPKFLGSFKIAYSLWSRDRYLKLFNTATGSNPSVFPLLWRDTVFTSLFGRYQIHEKVAVMGLLGYDQSLVQSDNNLVAFPIGDIYIGALGAEFQFTKSTALRFILGEGQVNHPRITNPSVDGRSRARFTFGDANLVLNL